MKTDLQVMAGELVVALSGRIWGLAREWPAGEQSKSALAGVLVSQRGAIMKHPCLPRRPKLQRS